MNDCLFCKIIKGEVPSSKVYENENIVAFLDINPVNPGHTLVVPKEHYENFSLADEKTLHHLVEAAQKVAKAIVKALGYEGYNIGVNNGSVAGQVIFHLHVHVMPRRPDDGHKLWKGKTYGEGEMEKVAAKIREAI